MIKFKTITRSSHQDQLQNVKTNSFKLRANLCIETKTKRKTEPIFIFQIQCRSPQKYCTVCCPMMPETSDVIKDFVFKAKDKNIAFKAKAKAKEKCGQRQDKDLGPRPRQKKT